MHPLLLAVYVCGLVGAYGMTLALLTGLARQKEMGWGALAFSLFPGTVYVIGYSVLGFLWGLMVWTYVSDEGPPATILERWKSDPIAALASTAVIAIVWTAAAVFLSRW